MVGQITSAIDDQQAERFAADLDSLIDPAAPIGVAVSGGPDSLALLLLAAAAARSGRVRAATVDHALRPESAAEAAAVAAICDRLGVPHETLRLDWPEAPESNLQARARDARYAALGRWASSHGLAAVATAHHADDQAETVLMRLARGSGVGGLAGIQRSRLLADGLLLVRPLLGWRRSELREIVERAGIAAVDDPSNRDRRFDRTGARDLLAATPWLDPLRLAAAAANAADADAALGWAAAREFEERHRRDGEAVSLDVEELPFELKRRLLLRAFAMLGATEPPGPEIARALAILDAGGAATLSGLKLDGGGTRWRLSPAPPRRH